MHKSIQKIKKSFLNRGFSILLVISTAVAITAMQQDRVVANSSFTATYAIENEKANASLQKRVIALPQKLDITKAIGSVNKKKSSLSRGKQKISTDLLQLVDDNFIPQGKTKQQLKDEMRVNNQYALSTSAEAKVSDSGEKVYVYVYLNPGVDIYATDSYIQEVTNRDAKNGIIVGWVDVSNLENLAADSNVRAIQTVTRPKVNIGSKTTEGVVAQNVDKVLSKFKQSGAGMKIGVISNGVNSMSSAVASGDLPSDVTVLSNTRTGSEGVAMLEIIYDMAPSAKLYFHDCGINTVAFNSAIDDLVAAGCNIIVDDISWLAQPFFEDGTVAQHVTDVLNSKNIVYVSAAGNDASNHYQGVYTPYSSTDSTHKYPLYVDIPPGESVDIFLEWDDKFGLSSNDYNLYLYDKKTNTVVGYSTRVQNGTGDPLEVITYTNNTGYIVYGDIYIDKPNLYSQAKTLEMFVYPSNDCYLYSDNITSVDSIFGHAAVPGALAVGAVDYNAPNTIRYYSSLGPTTISYPSSSSRPKPDICGVDGVSVTGAGNFYNPFYGTSASAPHIAAIAALLWAEFPQKTGNQIRDLLKTNAKDLGNTGLDTTYGYGISDAMKVFMATIADYCFTANITKNSTLPVTITSSGDSTNAVWFAPSGTTNFVQGQTMTKAAGDATSINAPTLSGNYKLYLVVDGIISAPSTATLTIDNTAPTNQNIVFATSISKKGGATVIIVSSGDTTNEVWFAPSGTTSFVAGATMTKATNGLATTILVPANEGAYKLYLIDAVGNVSVASTATLTVDNTAPINQDTVFAASVSKKSGATVTIVSSGDTTNGVWFAPAGTTSFVAGVTMTKATNGLATTILAPTTVGTYKLYLIDVVGNVSVASIPILTIDNTAPTNQNTVFATSISKKGGATVTIVSSGDTTNEVWFAPSGTTSFVAGTTMTKATNGLATTILASANAGTYKLYLIDAAGNISVASIATLTIDNTAPTNQNTVFATSISKKGGATVTIVSSGDTTNEVWFAPSGTTSFVAGATMTKATNGVATTILVPANEGAYKLYLIDAVGNVSVASTATLTVDNTVPTSIDSLILADVNGTKLSSLSVGQTIYVTSVINGTTIGTRVILVVYNNNKLLKTSILNYNGNGTYKTDFILPEMFGNLSCKVFVFNDIGSLRPLTTKKELQFGTYLVK